MNMEGDIQLMANMAANEILGAYKLDPQLQQAFDLAGLIKDISLPKSRVNFGLED